MISTTVAVKEISRLACLKGWRNMEKAGKEELVNALAQASSEYQAREAISTWLAEQIELPAPAKIRAQLQITRAKPETTAEGEDCKLCHGSGRESFWGVMTIERYEDTGRVKRRKLERIPPTPGREQFYLCEEPELAARVDGVHQRVAMFSRFCACQAGEQLKAAQREDG